ncbi:hypothetical protein [Mesorhizobium sp. M0854]
MYWRAPWLVADASPALGSTGSALAQSLVSAHAGNGDQARNVPAV